MVFPGTVDEAGQGLLNAAIQAGCGQHPQLHAVGDGATWIAPPVEDQFGTQGHYLLDFYPGCEYLAAASPHGVPDETPKPWLDQPKIALKHNDYPPVLKTHCH